MVGAVVAAAIVISFASSTHADEVQQSLNAFYSICLVDGPSFERTEAAAAVMGWKQLSADMLTMLAPRDKADAYKGWLITSSGYPTKTVVGVTKSLFKGKPVQTCTLAIGDVDGHAFQQALTTRLKVTKIDSSNDGMQEFHIYRVQASGKELIVTITLPVGPSVGVFTVSAMAEPR
jgi:hypothetical protein